jgi:hypothetical protein
MPRRARIAGRGACFPMQADVSAAVPLTVATDETQEWRRALSSLSLSRDSSTEPGDDSRLLLWTKSDSGERLMPEVTTGPPRAW